MNGVHLLAFATGFFSLSLEILWMRLFSFAHHSLPQAYAYVLLVALLGIALGAYVGRIFCYRHSDLWKVSGITLFAGSLMVYLTPLYYIYHAQSQYIILGGFLIASNFFLLSIIFPIVHHLGHSGNKQVGWHISKVYAANILGATIGPLVTGLLLLQLLTTQQAFFALTCGIFILSLFCQWHIRQKLVWQVLGFFSFSLLMISLTLQYNLFITTIVKPNGAIRRIIENPYGIIVTYHGGSEGDIVTGGNVYDGRANINPLIPSNGLERLIVLAALVDYPQNVLLIGLSIGSWLKVLTGFPGIESIDVVEINPGYKQAIHDYPKIENALTDTRVKLHFDDARRFLKLHAEKKYDLIIMNTTFNWRAYTSNLLSQEFLGLVKQHLQPRGLLAYNATGSWNVLKTATTLFRHAYFYSNFVFAADFDWRHKLKETNAIVKLQQITLDGTSLFPKGQEATLHAILSRNIIPVETLEPLFAALGRPLEIISDDNLITEYKYGLSLNSF